MWGKWTKFRSHAPTLASYCQENNIFLRCISQRQRMNSVLIANGGQQMKKDQQHQLQVLLMQVRCGHRISSDYYHFSGMTAHHHDTIFAIPVRSGWEAAFGRWVGRRRFRCRWRQVRCAHTCFVSACITLIDRYPAWKLSRRWHEICAFL